MQNVTISNFRITSLACPQFADWVCQLIGWFNVENLPNEIIGLLRASSCEFQLPLFIVTGVLIRGVRMLIHSCDRNLSVLNLKVFLCETYKSIISIGGSEKWTVLLFISAVHRILRRIVAFPFVSSGQLSYNICVVELGFVVMQYGCELLLARDPIYIIYEYFELFIAEF